jgi:tetratricopeptide (TPR) repeat protein
MKFIAFIAFYLPALFSISQTNCDSIQVLLNTTNLSEATKCKLLIDAAECYKDDNRLNALNKLSEAEVIAKKFSIADLESRAQYKIAKIYFDEGRLQEAKKYAQSALDLADKNPNDIDGKINSRKILSKVIFETGDINRSVELLNDAISIAKKHSKPILAAQCEFLVGNIYTSSGKFKEAELIYKSALNKINSKDDKTESIIYSNLGTLNVNMQNFDAADKYFSLALRLKRKIGDRKGEFLVLYQTAMLLFSQKKIDESLKYMSLCKELAQSLNDPILQGDVSKGSFAIFKSKGDNKTASKEIESAIKYYRQANEKNELLENYSAAEKFYSETGDQTNSYEYKRQYLALKDSINKVLGSSRPVETNENLNTSADRADRNIMRLVFIIVVALVGVIILVMKRK